MVTVATAMTVGKNTTHNTAVTCEFITVCVLPCVHCHECYATCVLPLAHCKVCTGSRDHCLKTQAVNARCKLMQTLHTLPTVCAPTGFTIGESTPSMEHSVWAQCMSTMYDHHVWTCNRCRDCYMRLLSVNTLTYSCVYTRVCALLADSICVAPDFFVHLSGCIKQKLEQESYNET